MARLTDEQQLTELLRRVELALGEVFIVERREKGVVTHRAVRNKDALQRAHMMHPSADFEDPRDGERTDQLRYASLEQAQAVHKEILRRIRVKEGH